MLKAGSYRIKIRPQVILQILADLQNHDPLKGHGFATTLDEQFGVVNLLDKLRAEGLLLGGGGGGFEPIGGGYLCKAVALDFGEGDGVGSGGER